MHSSSPEWKYYYFFVLLVVPDSSVCVCLSGRVPSSWLSRYWFRSACLGFVLSTIFYISCAIKRMWSFLSSHPGWKPVLVFSTKNASTLSYYSLHWHGCGLVRAVWTRPLVFFFVGWWIFKPIAVSEKMPSHNMSSSSCFVFWYIWTNIIIHPMLNEQTTWIKTVWNARVKIGQT